MATFIHTSDWHIGNAFSGFNPNIRQRLNRARLKAVESIFTYAQKKKIPLILCAGDAIDNGQLAPETLLLDLFAVIRHFPGIQLLMITGNHDPLMANTVYGRVSPGSLPDNFRLLWAEEERIDIPEMNLAILAASTRRQNSNQNPLHWLKPGDIDHSKIAIGLSHGSIENESFGDNQFPIPAGFARSVGLDYLALGDWHSYKKINERTYYPGTPEPLQFGDDGYALEVSIDRPGALPRVERITGVSQFHWQQEEIMVTDESFSSFKEKLVPVTEKEIKTLSISGFLSVDNYRAYEQLIYTVRERYHAIHNRVELAPSREDLENIGDLAVQSMIRQLLSLKQAGQPLAPEVLNHVLPAGHLDLDELIPISPADIIDAALVKLYRYLAGQDPARGGNP